MARSGEETPNTASPSYQRPKTDNNANANDYDNNNDNNNDNDKDNSSSSSSDLNSWKHRPPYTLHRASSPPTPHFWTGRCHCGKVEYTLSRQRPLSSKYCHCQTCQRLHGAPFQWAAIFHKTDIHFTRGHHDLAWYDPGECTTRHKLPCKVSCGFCRTPIMDEGRNMVLLFPSLIEGIGGAEGRRAFRVRCHLFYGRRLVEFRDGVEKWEGLNGKSRRLGDDGEYLDGGEEGERKGEDGFGDGHGDDEGDRENERAEEKNGNKENGDDGRVVMSHANKRQKVGEEE